MYSQSVVSQVAALAGVSTPILQPHQSSTPVYALMKPPLAPYLGKSPPHVQSSYSKNEFNMRSLNLMETLESNHCPLKVQRVTKNDSTLDHRLALTSKPGSRGAPTF